MKSCKLNEYNSENNTELTIISVAFLVYQERNMACTITKNKDTE